MLKVPTDLQDVEEISFIAIPRSICSGSDAEEVKTVPRLSAAGVFAAGVPLNACAVGPLQITGPYASRFSDSDVQQR
jgi:hypothetical protein